MNKKHLVKPAILVLMMAAALFIWQFTPAKQYISIENAGALARYADSLGPAAPLIYLAFVAFGTVFLVPGSLLAVVGALSFGAGWGIPLVSLGTCLGAGLAFLTSRYLARPLVERLIKNRPIFQRIDEGVNREGWRMVAVTRLLPVFPYIFINYALGLTKIRFSTYMIVTWVAMLPANIAMVLAAGSLVSGGNDWKKIFIYLFIAGGLFAILAVLPMILRKRLSPDLVQALKDERPEKKKLRPRTLLYAVVLFAVVLLSVFAYNLNQARLRGTIALEELTQYRKALSDSAKILESRLQSQSKFKQQFDILHESAEDSLGYDTMKMIEMPICEAWKPVIEQQGFRVLGCVKHTGIWFKAMLQGPKEKKKRLYEALETNLHPVSVRMCLVDESKDELRVALMMADNYNQDPPLALANINDPQPPKVESEKWMLYRDEIKKIEEEIEKLHRRITNLKKEVIAADRLRVRSALLLSVVSKFEKNKKSDFDLEKMERSATLFTEKEKPQEKTLNESESDL